jgi:hypothetical protein
VSVIDTEVTGSRWPQNTITEIVSAVAHAIDLIVAALTHAFDQVGHVVMRL